MLCCTLDVIVIVAVLSGVQFINILIHWPRWGNLLSSLDRIKDLCRVHRKDLDKFHLEFIIERLE